MESEILTTCSVPIYLEHRRNLQLLQSLPPETIDWSMLCPGNMVPEHSDVTVPTRPLKAKLIANATTPPAWKDSWMKYTPLIGKSLLSATNAMRYETTLEQAADFIASDLEQLESEWSEKTVGIIDPSK